MPCLARYLTVVIILRKLCCSMLLVSVRFLTSCSATSGSFDCDITNVIFYFKVTVCDRFGAEQAIHRVFFCLCVSPIRVCYSNLYNLGSVILKYKFFNDFRGNLNLNSFLPEVLNFWIVWSNLKRYIIRILRDISILIPYSRCEPFVFLQELQIKKTNYFWVSIWFHLVQS